MFTLAMILVVLTVPFIVMPRDIRLGTVSPYSVVLKSVIVTMIGVLLVMAAARFSGNALLQSYHAFVEKMAEALASDENYKQLLGADGMSKGEAKAAITALYDLMIKRVPGYMIASATIVSYFGYMMISRGLAKNQQVQRMPKFKDFNLPKSSVLPILVMYFAAWLIGRGESPVGEIFYMNVSYVFDFVFVIQGASVFFQFCETRRWPKAVAVILVILFWNVYILRQVMVMLGIFDLVMGMKNLIVLKAQMREQNKIDKRKR